MFRISSLAVFITFSLSAQDIRTVPSIVDSQVLQRDAQNHAVVKIEPATAKVKVSGGKSSYKNGELTLNAGGPYTIEIKAGATKVIKDVLVGDLWILAGQSNMEGVGDLVDVEAPSPQVHLFDMTDAWGVAKEPLHRIVDAADSVHQTINKLPGRMSGAQLEAYISKRKKGAGLGLPFAKYMVQYTGVPVGLVACAHGGTSMNQWTPSRKDEGGASLYGAMVRRHAAVGGKVKGLLWYQGEAEAGPKQVVEFQEKFEKFIQAVRDDFKQSELPFYYVQIGRVINAGNENEWNQVQEIQRIVESKVPNTKVISAIDSDLDDLIHAGTQDLKKLGKRMANIACHDMSVPACASYKAGPRPLSAKAEAVNTVRVTFGEVNGELKHAGRLTGFSIHNAAGAAVPLIFKAKVDPKDKSSVVLYLTGKLPEGATLRYGAGKDPYCNLDDSLGMGTPVFGPMAIQ